ncbi:MAG: PEP-CTERM sorting domain-containing protein [Pseudomonadota bacterium]
MKRMALLALVGGLVSGAAQAALHDRGGGLVYDDVLDVTWLADANYARTSGYDADGKMEWPQANDWAANLSYYDGVRGLTYDDWRLPSVRDGGQADYNFGYAGTDVGYNVRTVGEDGTVYSELAHMYFNNLGFKSSYSPSGNSQSDSGIFGNGTTGGERDGVGPNGAIVNLQSDVYWSSAAYAPDPVTLAWVFIARQGTQGAAYQDGYGQDYERYAWAVRPGDVAAVPEPLPAALFGVGLLGLMLARRRSGAARG